VKILNNGNVRGLPVLRTMMNRQREFNPQAFHVFGPKIVATAEMESDQDAGYCEACGGNTVTSALVLAGLI
jgi:hypothetical protein